MNKDRYEEIINGYDTVTEIASKLKGGQSVIIGWTDEKYTHLDLLFNYRAHKDGMLQ